MLESLAHEVAGFKIKVTLIEPGPFTMDFMSGSSMKQTRPIAAYDENRLKLLAEFTPDVFRASQSTVGPVFKIVDADEPPLRIIFGPHLPAVRQVYAARLKSWEQWEAVANATQRSKV